MTTWNLASSDGTVEILFYEDDSNGLVKGSLRANNSTFQVQGAWSASGSLPGRNASAFALSGSDELVAPTWISASGIMVGPGSSPQSIEIQIDTASSSGELSSIDAVLLPKQ